MQRYNNSKDGQVRIFIGIGSNLGDRFVNVEAALDWLVSSPFIKLMGHAQLIETEPWGVTNQPRFVNSVAEAFTQLSPHDLLEQLKTAEKELGRKHTGIKWGPRVIDLDILLYGDLVIETADLTIPHEHLTERHFLLEQLISLDTNLVHPKFQQPLYTFK